MNNNNVVITSNRLYLYDHTPLNFTFMQNKDDFVVEEIPLNQFTNNGNVLILKIRKIDLSTWDLIKIISEILNISESLIGYAGLKDKNATTTQYISIPLNKSKEYKLLNSKNIKVLDTFRHNQKLKIGDLLGNRFKINIKDIDPNDIGTIYQIISKIQKHGMPNYFGYQRFGIENDFEKTKSIVYGETLIKDKKLNKFLSTAYQSYFFNSWLSKRVQLSKDQNSNKLISIEGDIFNSKTITGLLPGRKIIRAKAKAREIEELYDDLFIHNKGYRRDAWINPSMIKNHYNSKTNSMMIEFTLPKSSYATVFIESIANKNFGYTS